MSDRSIEKIGMEIKAKGREDDLFLALAQEHGIRNAERTVVVAYNPLTATKQGYAFEAKLQKLQAVRNACQSQG